MLEREPEPSRTLLAMGVERGLARAAVRVSLGRDTRADDVRSFIIETFVRMTDELKNLASIGGLNRPRWPFTELANEESAGETQC